MPLSYLSHVCSWFPLRVGQQRQKCTYWHYLWHYLQQIYQVSFGGHGNVVGSYTPPLYKVPSNLQLFRNTLFHMPLLKSVLALCRTKIALEFTTTFGRSFRFPLQDFGILLAHIHQLSTVHGLKCAAMGSNVHLFHLLLIPYLKDKFQYW